MADDFFQTDHCKLLAAAKRFLYSADVLRRSEDYKSNRILFTPTLHLIAHGIEVLLKANLVGSGLHLSDLRSQYGHDICALWNHNGNWLLRRQVFSEARRAWDNAANGPDWQDSFEDNPESLLAEYLKSISALHTSKTDYALRYIASPELIGPRPHLLVDSFLPVSDMLLKQPNALL
jgi:hypothetical protein